MLERCPKETEGFVLKQAGSGQSTSLCFVFLSLEGSDITIAGIELAFYPESRQTIMVRHMEMIICVECRRVSTVAYVGERLKISITLIRTGNTNSCMDNCGSKLDFKVVTRRYGLITSPTARCA